MSFDFSSLFWIFIVIMVLQPLLTARWYGVRRAQAIRAVEKLHGTRVITMIHRQEKRSLFGFAVSRHIDLEDAQTIIAAIKDTPEDMPIDFVIHTPGGLVLAAMQIARALEAHKAKVTVYVPVYAMSGGTLLALAANEIVLGEFSVLGPIDPQIAGLPAASIVKARELEARGGRFRPHAGSCRCGGEGPRPGQARGSRTVNTTDGTVGSGGPRHKACGRTLDT